ncbi:MAG: CDP-diacylglycerol--serine O-phosphatidyltransferase [Acidobacteria bacterium]|nr:CDP-diacylglycerol--serine O-phosphatidyltransferase [Acidobacteriota bacterium]
MIRKPKATQRLKRGIPLLPSLFTVGNLFCGYYSLIATLRGEYAPAALAIGIAMVADGLDGRIARMTNSESAFGGALDSVSDALTFGMAPAALMYSWALSDLERIGWMTSFFFLACSATRLARFTVQTGHHDRRYFVGLPAPPAAAMLAAMTFYSPAKLTAPIVSYGVVVMVVMLAILMISKIRYRSFKNIDLRTRRPYPLVAVLAIGFALVANAPQTVLLLLASTYLASGPAEKIWQQLRRHRQKLPAATTHARDELEHGATDRGDLGHATTDLDDKIH